MKWHHVSEDLPPENKIVLAYSEIDGIYTLAQWSSARGWLDQDSDDLKIITHWNEICLPLNFEITEKNEEELAKKYGFKMVKSLF